MLLFWIAAAVLSAAAAALVLWRAGRAPAEAQATPEAAVYARQLAELDEARARGLLDEAGWTAARAEAGRRLLAVATDAPEMRADPAAGRSDRAWVVAGAALTVIVGVALYGATGRPGRADQPFEQRLKLWTAAMDSPRPRIGPAEAAAVFERRARAAPGVLENWTGLAQARINARQFPLAVQALEKAAALAPDNPRIWDALGETRVVSAEGQVGPEARRAFVKALSLDPGSPAALWWLGRDEVLHGRRDRGLMLWRVLAKTLPPGGAQQTDVQNQIAAVEAGRPMVDTADSAPANGGGAAQAVASAAPAQQQQMIRAMVAGLDQRLSRGGGKPEDWARLVRAYGVLGDTAARDRALAQARKQFAADPAGLAIVEQAAPPRL